MKLYSYCGVNRDRPDWAPLVAIAQRTADRADVPTIAPDDFMWMCAVESLDGAAPLHLYKHITTRRYLNVDTDLRMYAWVDDLGDDELLLPDSELVVRYRRLGGLVWALERLDLGWRRFHDDALEVLRVAADNCATWPANVTPLSPHRRHRGGSVA